MNRLVLLLLLILFSFSLNAQEEIQAKENIQTTDILGIQAGILGVRAHYEKSLHPQFTIDGSIGYTGGFMKGTDQKLDYIFTTKIIVSPRYYYNMEKRFKNGKKTFNNSANFLAIDLSYIPDWGTSTNRKNVGVDKSFAIIPKYGLRRVISKNLNFHFDFGAGYQWNDQNNNGLELSLTLMLDLNFL